MSEKYKYPCPACGFIVFCEPIGSFDICPVCGWEDDNVQYNNPEFRGGANKHSLIEHQIQWISAIPLSISEKIIGFKKIKCKRDPNWQPHINALHFAETQIIFNHDSLDEKIPKDILQETNSKLTDFEKVYLTKFKQYFPTISYTNTTSKNSNFEITIKSLKTENDIIIWIEENEIGVEIGKWTHTHFNNIDESVSFIKDILNDFIVVWKVTKPDGSWYSGHYDIRLWNENVEKNDWDYNLIDEPDSMLEPNSFLEKSTFNRIIE